MGTSYGPVSYGMLRSQHLHPYIYHAIQGAGASSTKGADMDPATILIDYIIATTKLGSQIAPGRRLVPSQIVNTKLPKRAEEKTCISVCILPPNSGSREAFLIV